jgi:hypothetical protein
MIYEFNHQYVLNRGIMPLIYHALEEYICSAIANCENRLLVICPFIKIAPLSRILINLAPRVKVDIITSWKLTNFTSGVSDVDIFKFCKHSGIRLRANNRIHLKVWLIDDTKLLATSANITDSALGAVSSPNHEFLTDNRPCQPDFKALETILNESIEITDGIYLKTLELLEQWVDYKPVDIDLLDYELALESLVDDIPRTSNPQELYFLYSQAGTTFSEDVEHDLERLKIPAGLCAESFMSALDRSFFRLPIIRKVASRLSEAPIYFGEIKAFLQDVNDSDPKPTRRELTSIAQNLYKWLTALRPSQFIVDKPCHSERLTMRIPDQR